MPYIDPRIRPAIEPFVEQLANAIFAQVPQVSRAGAMNFAISRLIVQLYGNVDLQSYKAINEIVGVLECTKLEFFRRVAAPFEDGKMVEHGDVYDEK